MFPAFLIAAETSWVPSATASAIALEANLFKRDAGALDWATGRQPRALLHPPEFQNKVWKVL